MRNQVIECAKRAGIAESEFEGWDGKRIALYRDVVGRGPDASRRAKDKVRAGNWVLDLGNRSSRLARQQGIALDSALTDAGITPERMPLKKKK